MNSFLLLYIFFAFNFACAKRLPYNEAELTVDNIIKRIETNNSAVPYEGYIGDIVTMRLIWSVHEKYKICSPWPSDPNHLCYRKT